MSTLRDPTRGEKATIMRELMEKHPDSGNTELAGMLLDVMKKKGIREEREVPKIAQAFANQKATDKRKAGKAGRGRRGGRRAAAVAAENGSARGFTLLDLEAVDVLAKRMGGYEPLMKLVQFMASRG